MRVFTYYPITDWSNYFSKVVSPENGEDVYTFTRDGIEVRFGSSDVKALLTSNMRDFGVFGCFDLITP